MFTCCQNCSCGWWLQIIEIAASLFMVIFAFLAIAVARTNALIDKKVALMPIRTKIAYVMIEFLKALKHGFDKVTRKAEGDRTTFKMGFEWLSVITSAQSYEKIAHTLGYEPKKEDAPYRVYSDGLDGFSDLIEQARYVFSKEVYSELKKLNKHFLTYGSLVTKPENLTNVLSKGELDEIESFCNSIDGLEKNIESETQLDKMPRPFSIAMIKLLFGGFGDRG